MKSFAAGLLRALSLSLLKIHRFSIKRPKLVLSFTLILIILSLASATRLRFLLIIDDLMDQDFKTWPSLTQLAHDFPDKNNLFLIVHPNKNAGPSLTHDDLCDLLSWITDVSIRRPEIDRIYSSFGVRKVQKKEDGVVFTPILRDRCGSLTTDTSPLAIKRELEELRASPWGGFLTSHNADDILISIYLKDGDKNSRFGAFDARAVKEVRDDFQSHYLEKHPHTDAVWTGIGTYEYFLKKAYDQSAFLNVIAILIVLILFRTIYGTWKSGLLFQATLIPSLILTYGFMGMMKYPIDSLTNALPTLVMIATLEDFIFISHLKRFEAMSSRAAFRKTISASFFTSLTTAIGFGSLATADLMIIRRFGICCSIAAMLEWLATYTILPALLVLRPSLHHWAPSTPQANSAQVWIETLLKKLSRLKPKPLISKLALLVFLTPVFLYLLNINDSPEEIFPSGHPVRKAAEYLFESRGWKSEMSLVFERYDQESINEALLSNIKTDPLVAAIENPYQVESYLTQDTDKKDWVKFLWNQSVASTRLISSDSNRARVILYLKSTEIQDIHAFRERVDRVCGEHCHLAGTLNSYGEFGDRVLSSLLKSLGSSLVLVALVLTFLCLAFGEKSIGRILLSSFWGVAALLSCFIIFQIKVFFVSCIIASIVVGLAGDNVIQYIFLKNRKQNVDDGANRVGTASFLIALFMICVSSSLVLSEFGALRTLSGLMILGFSLMVVGDYWILQGLKKEALAKE